jgi:hypothetical protein
MSAVGQDAGEAKGRNDGKVLSLWRETDTDILFYVSHRKVMTTLRRNTSLLLPLWEIVMNYLSSLKAALAALVRNYFEAPKRRFNEIEDAIGERWKATTNDLDHVRKVYACFADVGPNYVLGVSQCTSQSYTKQAQLADIMEFAPSRVYAQPMPHVFWKDSLEPVLNPTSSHFQMLLRYDEKSKIAAQHDNTHEDVSDRKGTDQKNNANGIESRFEKKVSGGRAARLLYQYLKNSTIAQYRRAEYLFQTRYGVTPDVADAMDPISLAKSVPLDLPYAHLQWQREEWRRRRDAYRNVACERLVNQLTLILLRADGTKEIEVTYRCSPDSESQERMHVRICSAKTGACLLYINVTSVHDNCMS